MSSSRPEPVEYVHRSWPADARQLPLIRRSVRAWLAPFALDALQVADLVVAVDEAATNTVDHAYGPGQQGTVELLMWTEPGVLYVEVVDHGKWKPPTTAESYRGRGIQMMHHMTDSVMIHYDRRGTRVSLRHGLPGHLPLSG